MSSEDNIVSIARALGGREPLGGRERHPRGAGGHGRSAPSRARGAGRNLIFLARAGAGAPVLVLPVGRTQTRRRPQGSPEPRFAPTPPDAA